MSKSPRSYRHRTIGLRRAKTTGWPRRKSKQASASTSQPRRLKANGKLKERLANDKKHGNARELSKVFETHLLGRDCCVAFHCALLRLPVKPFILSTENNGKRTPTSGLPTRSITHLSFIHLHRTMRGPSRACTSVLKRGAFSSPRW